MIDEFLEIDLLFSRTDKLSQLFLNHIQILKTIYSEEILMTKNIEKREKRQVRKEIRCS